MQFFLFITVVILILIGVVTVQNPGVIVTVKFIKWTFSGSIALGLAIPFTIGIVASMLIFVPLLIKKISLARHQKKQIKDLEIELAEVSDRTASGEIEQDIKSFEEDH